jgi:uncharacterized membrane protein YphA (DoxX/SURF4 family)
MIITLAQLGGPDPALLWIAAATLSIIFAGSALMKLHDIESFRSVVEDFRVLPDALALSFAISIPIIELVSAAAVLTPGFRLLAAIALLLLLLTFSAAIAINLLRGRRGLDCGCFGALLRQKLSGWLLVRNGILAALAARLLTPPLARPMETLDVATIVFASAAAVVLYLAMNYLIANAPKSRALRSAYA